MVLPIATAFNESSAFWRSWRIDRSDCNSAWLHVIRGKILAKAKNGPNPRDARSKCFILPSKCWCSRANATSGFTPARPRAVSPLSFPVDDVIRVCRGAHCCHEL
jgi:hypothetical protein